MMLVKAPILRGNYSVLEIGRYLAKRNEFVPFLVGGAANPGRETALDLHGGSRRVNPSHSHKEQRRKRPKKQCAGDKPSNKEPEGPPPNRGLLGRRGGCRRRSHISEYSRCHNAAMGNLARIYFGVADDSSTIGTKFRANLDRSVRSCCQVADRVSDLLLPELVHVKCDLSV